MIVSIKLVPHDGLCKRIGKQTNSINNKRAVGLHGRAIIRGSADGKNMCSTQQGRQSDTLTGHSPYEREEEENSDDKSTGGRQDSLQRLLLACIC